MSVVRNGFHIYDTHTHLGVARHSGRRWSAGDMLRWMDSAGVDRAVAIPFPVVEDHRAAHDEIARAVREHPDRLVGAACLHPFLPEREFRAEVRRCAEVFGFRALKLQPQHHGLNPISPRSDFFFETALENDLTLICHTGTGAPYALPSLFILPAQKHPGLRIVLGHAGGSVYVGEAIVAAAVCPNIYIELSSLMPHHIAEVLVHIPSNRLMIGSDLPESAETEIGKIFHLNIPDQAKRDILWNTACEVFRA